ncbi:hypothetical protein [Janibacter hoylei]|uniref:hypothetical protein n=1 Tax=Janibacter hoylei TaxID=364298 RepID=UPI0024925A69|nr:hypothetical protein [Janibacter hoylei]
MLGTAAARSPAGQGSALHALYVCACITEHPCPDWIIYGTDAGIGWRTWPDDLSDDDEVHATYRADVHTDPTDLLAWLEGRTKNPWAGGAVNGDSAQVLHGLRRWLTHGSDDAEK